MKPSAKPTFPNGQREFEIAHKFSGARYTMIAPTAEQAWHRFTRLGFRKFANPQRLDWDIEKR